MESVLMKRMKRSGRNNRPGLPGRLIEDILLLIGLTADFIRGRYRRVPMRSIAVFLFVLVYVFSPLDIIPDYLPGYGQIDDVIVLTVFAMYSDFR